MGWVCPARPAPPPVRRPCGRGFAPPATSLRADRIPPAADAAALLRVRRPLAQSSHCGHPASSLRSCSRVPVPRDLTLPPPAFATGQGLMPCASTRGSRGAMTGSVAGQPSGGGRRTWRHRQSPGRTTVARSFGAAWTPVSPCSLTSSTPATWASTAPITRASRCPHRRILAAADRPAVPSTRPPRQPSGRGNWTCWHGGTPASPVASWGPLDDSYGASWPESGGPQRPRAARWRPQGIVRTDN